MTPTANTEKAWSVQQTAIFAWFAAMVGHLVVRARAGTGKTTTILEAITHAPSHVVKILVCAFGNAIAKELSARVTDPRAEAKTLHSLGLAFTIQQVGKVKVDFGRGMTIARRLAKANGMPDALVGDLAKLAAYGKNIRPLAKSGADLLDLALEFDLVPSDEMAEAGWPVERLCNGAYSAMMSAANVQRDMTVDGDDMQFVPVRNGWMRGIYDLIVVDEAQDMCPTQLLLAQGACRKGGSIVVVGDDRQAIYGFRGADSGAIDRLKAELPAEELGLTVTYRCPKAVVALAQQLVPDFSAAETAPEGSVVDMPYKALVDAATAGNFVLSRKNAPLARVCLAFLRNGKRAVVRGKDIGAGLIALVKKLGGKQASVVQFLAKLAAWEKRELARWEAADKPAKASEAADRAETLRALSEGIESVQKLIDRVESLFSDNDINTAVVCSSVHKAKGLEADRVFLLVDTLYPGKYGAGKIEEQNIHYVAVTRAKRELVLVQGLE